MHHAAFQLGLVAHVRQIQSLPLRNGSFERYETALVVGVESFGLFVERLLIGVRAVDEQRRLVMMPKIGPPLGILRTTVVCARLLRIAPLDAGSLAFSLFQRFPDSAHSNLPSDCMASLHVNNKRGAVDRAHKAFVAFSFQ